MQTQVISVLNQEESVVPVVDKLAQYDQIIGIELELTAIGWDLHIDSELEPEKVLQLVKDCGGLLYVN